MFFLGAQPSPLDPVLGAIVLIAVVGGLAALGTYGWRQSRIQRRLYSFFGSNYHKFPVVSRPFSSLDVPNVHRAMKAWAEELGGTLATLSVTNKSALNRGEIFPASSQFLQVDVDVDEREECLVNPLFLLRAGDRKWAVVMNGVSQYGGPHPGLEVMSTTRDLAADGLETIRRLMRVHSIYRGKVISIEGGDGYDDGTPGWTKVRFHHLPEVSGDAIILPVSTMRLIHRNTVGFFAQAARLKAQGHSVKRGLLFHGPPGTGKTRTACWLTHSLPNVTVFLVTGEQLWNIKECCHLAKMLAPAMLILEDVDLIAVRREQNYQTTALHQLMNEMDGLDSDAEVLFLLTTNRPDEIEPALANRPGRIDQAIHFPLPDEDCRKRLVELYRGKSDLRLTNWGPVLRGTDGSSPAFIKEFVRKAALIAAEEQPDGDGTLILSDDHFAAALKEMTAGDGALTRRLVGFAPPTSV